MTRRTIVGLLLGILGQKAVMQKGKAVVCSGEPIKCPLNHDTCKQIDAPLVVGNDRRDYPESAQLFDVHVFACEVCGMLFTVK